MAISRWDDPQVRVDIEGYGSITAPGGVCAANLIQGLDNLKWPVMAVIIDNELLDLHHTIDHSCRLKLVDTSSPAGLEIFRRTAAFIMIKACNDLFPERKLVVRHSLSNGLFCEFQNQAVSLEEIEQLSARMEEIVAQNMMINRVVFSREKARLLFENQGKHDKARLIEFLDDYDVELYELDGLYEYFCGFVAPDTGRIKTFRVLSYSSGIILQTPELDAPDKIKTYVEQPKLAGIFKEAKDWTDMLDTPHAATLNYMIQQDGANDIIRVNEALHEKKIASIADQICNQGARLVLISGPSSSGKTTFAQRLLIQLRVLGKRPVSISLDNYFVDRDKTPKDEDNNYDFEALEALDLELFNQHLARIIAGEKVEVPVYNFKRGTRDPQGVLMQVPREEPIIIEGIHGLNDRLTWSIPADHKFKIYISALTQLNIDSTNRIPTTDSRLIRRMVRDNRTRGYNALATIKRWPSVRRGEEKNIFPFQERADVMFNSSLVYELSVLRPHVEPLLQKIGPQHPEHVEAARLMKLLSYFRPLPTEPVPPNSILREFIGGSWFRH